MSDIFDYSDVLRNLSAAYESRIKNLSEIRNITFELKYAIEDEEQGVADDLDDFDEILDRRESKINEQKVIMTTINHYKSQLPSDILAIINSAEREVDDADGFDFAKEIKKITAAEKIISGEIKAAENFNITHMKTIMGNVKKKLDHIKKNRIITDKFLNAGNEIKTGALINKKK